MASQSFNPHAYPPHLAPSAPPETPVTLADEYATSSYDDWGPSDVGARSTIADSYVRSSSHPLIEQGRDAGYDGGYSSGPMYSGVNREGSPHLGSTTQCISGEGPESGFAPAEKARGEEAIAARGDEKLVGRWYQLMSLNQAALISVLLLQTIAVLVMIAIVFARVQHEILTDSARLKTISTYLGVFVIANVFSIVMAFDALQNKNTVQLIGLVLFDYLMMVYGAVLPEQVKGVLQQPGMLSFDLSQTGDNCSQYLSCFGIKYLYEQIEWLVITIPVITGVCATLSAYLTFRLYKEFGWDLFKILGADITLRKVFAHYQMLTVVNKFTVFFFVGFAIQFLILVENISAVQKGLTIAAVPVSLAVIALCAIGIKNEIHALMGVFALCWVGALTYYVYKLVKIYQDSTGAFEVARRSLTLFCILSIFLLFVTGFLAIMCWRNFGKGLKELQVKTSLGIFQPRHNRGKAERPESRMSLE